MDVVKGVYILAEAKKPWTRFYIFHGIVVNTSSLEIIEVWIDRVGNRLMEMPLHRPRLEQFFDDEIYDVSLTNA